MNAPTVKKAISLAALAATACLAGCAGRQGPPGPGQRALVHQVRSYVLGKVPDQEREMAFLDLLEAAQAAAIEKHGAASETGFSYSLAPKGAVYPFSEVEVSCLIQKADASEGKRLCSEFFKAVAAGLDGLLKDK